MLKVHDSYGKSHYGTMVRKTFDSKDLVLKHKGDNAAHERCNLFLNWYKNKVLFPIYKDSHDFNQGVSQEFWGNIRYHGPIFAHKWKQTICFYLHATDQEQRVCEEVFVCLYDKKLDSIKTWLHTGYIAPPDTDCLLILHNGIDHFNWIRRHEISESVAVYTKEDMGKNVTVSPKGSTSYCIPSIIPITLILSVKKNDIDTEVLDPAHRNRNITNYGE